MESSGARSRAFSAQQEQAERGGAHIVRADQITDDERDIGEQAARVVLEGGQGSLAEQMKSRPAASQRRCIFLVAGARSASAAWRAGRSDTATDSVQRSGGFAGDGREYVIVLGQEQVTPAPWINVIANPVFGFTISERGAGYTWALNSSENKLTPWSNDPVSDPCGEAFYLRDEESGALWSSDDGR